MAEEIKAPQVMCSGNTKAGICQIGFYTELQKKKEKEMLTICEKEFVRSTLFLCRITQDRNLQNI